MRRLVFAVVAAVAVSGCARPTEIPLAHVDGAPATVVPGASLGRAGANGVFVAVLPGRKTIRVYACDGADLRNATVDQWFAGGYDGIGPVTLTAGGLSLTIRTMHPGFRGELTLADGTVLPFDAAQPTDAESALLDGEARDPTTGAIVRAGTVIVLGGEQRGVVLPTRKPCRFVLVTGPNGGQQWVSVCS
jgi:hypothetical protein